MNLRPLLPLAALLVAIPLAQAQSTKVLSADKHNDYGLVYTLPITALSIEVTARRTVEKAGPYYQYAKKYVGTTQVVAQDAERWEIEKLTVTPYGIPDDQQRYLMQLKQGALTYIGVADNGMLLSINREPETPFSPSTKSVTTEKVTLPTGREYLKYATEDFLASQSSAKQAQMLAESLMEVRDAKIALTRGTAETMPSDGRQLELMLASLADQERVMTEAFTGSVTTQSATRTFTFTPADDGKSILFRLSDFAGFVEPDDLSGEPVYISVKMTREQQLPVDEKGVEKKLPKDAVMYALPGAAEITITWMGQTLYRQELEFAQYGTIFGLSPSLFTDKKEPSYAIFNPATGAIEAIGNASF